MSQIQVPKGYEKKILEEICTIDGGYAFKSNDYQNSGIPLVRISNIQNEKVQFKANTVFLDKNFLDKYGKFLIKRGDILIALSGATTGKCGIYYSKEPALLNQRVGRISLHHFEPNLQQYLFYFFKKIGNDIFSKSYGGAQPNISPKDIESFEILIPTDHTKLSKIIQKLDYVLGQLEEKKKEILELNNNVVNQLTNHYDLTKKTILTELFNGKLTHEKKFPSAEKLLETVYNLRMKKIKNNQYKIVKYQVQKPNELIPPYKIPERWVWVQLGDLIESMKNGIYKPSSFYGDGIPCLRMYNIQDGKIVLKNVKQMILTEDEILDYGLQEDDILFNRVNSRELVAKSAVIPHGMGTMIFESKNIRIRLWPGLINPYYVNYYLQTNHMRQLIETTCKKTAGMATIPQTHIAQWLIPLCSQEEQEEIVQIINQKMKMLEEIHAKTEVIKVRNAQLKNSFPIIENHILDKAFSGKLVN